jgi:hypothetical protein
MNAKTKVSVMELTGGILIAVSITIPLLLFTFMPPTASHACGAPEEHHFPRTGLTFVRYACSDGSYEWELKP